MDLIDNEIIKSYNLNNVYRYLFLSASQCVAPNKLLKKSILTSNFQIQF